MVKVWEDDKICNGEYFANACVQSRPLKRDLHWKRYLLYLYVYIGAWEGVYIHLHMHICTHVRPVHSWTWVQQTCSMGWCDGYRTMVTTSLGLSFRGALSSHTIHHADTPPLPQAAVVGRMVLAQNHVQKWNPRRNHATGWHQTFWRRLSRQYGLLLLFKHRWLTTVRLTTSMVWVWLHLVICLPRPWHRAW